MTTAGAAARAIGDADWPSASRIHEREVNLVLLPRDPPAWIADALDRLGNPSSLGLEYDGLVTTVGERVAADLARRRTDALGAWLAADVRMLLAGWARISGETRCRLGLEAVGSDACRKFHTDVVRIRLLCTYRGPGTEWVADDGVRRSRLGPHGENEDIVPDPSRIRHVPRFAVALLKGDAYDAHTAGVVHRSPPLPPGTPPRLLLRINGMR